MGIHIAWRDGHMSEVDIGLGKIPVEKRNVAWKVLKEGMGNVYFHSKTNCSRNLDLRLCGFKTKSSENSSQSSVLDVRVSDILRNNSW